MDEKQTIHTCCVYQVKFNATYEVGDPASPKVLNAFDYGFIEVIAAPVRAITLLVEKAVNGWGPSKTSL